MPSSILALRGVRSALVITSLAVAAIAAADVDTYNFDITPAAGPNQEVSNGLARTNWSNLLGVTKFDASKGTLDAVKVSFNWAGRIDGFVGNNSMSEGTIEQLMHNLNVRLTTTGGDILGTSGVMSLGTLTSIPGSVSPGDRFSYAFNRDGMVDFTFSPASASFASLFIGSGNLDLLGGARASYGLSQDGNLIEEHNTFASLSGSVSYTYTRTAPTVPGPSAALAMGLGALRVVRRRKARGQA